MKKKFVSFLLALMLALTEATGGSVPSVVFASEINSEANSDVKQEVSEDEEENTSADKSNSESDNQTVSKEDVDRFNDMIPDNLNPIDTVKTDCDNLTEAVFGDEEDGLLELNGAGITGLESYDPRVENPELVTPTRDQNPYGTCWAFGCIGMIETNLIKRGFCDNSIDLSELHLAYFAYNAGIDELGDSDENDTKCNSYYLDLGGNVSISAGTLLNWHGVALEENYPYEDAADNIVAFEDGQDDAYTLSDAYFIPVLEGDKEAKKQALKSLINEYGAVTIAYCSESEYYSYGDGYTAYNSGDMFAGDSNHEVELVGWDDNFSKDNFNKKPSEDGAWLIKNSWGEDWGTDGGYFYVSYEDESLGSEAAVYVVNDKDTYDNNYFNQNSRTSNGYNTQEKSAEIFKMKKASEELAGVTVGFAEDNVKYKIDVYKLDTTNEDDVTDPTKGTLLMTQTGKTTLPGYYTIDFDKTATVSKDDLISVVVTDQDGNDVEIYTDFDSIKSTSTGKSFYFQDGEWIELVDEMYDEETDSYTSYKTTYYINVLTNTKSESDSNVTVTFVDENGNILSTKSIKTGGFVTKLSNPTGYSYSYDYDFSKTVTKDTTIKVTKKPVEYSISYVLNGGSNSKDNPSVYTIESGNEEGKIILADATKENFSFAGWYTDKSFTEQITEIDCSDLKNYTLYAAYNGKNNLSILPLSSDINENEEISISADSGDIFYTLDGSEPTRYSSRYTGPFCVSQDVTVKAINIVDETVVGTYERSYNFNRIQSKFAHKTITMKQGETISNLFLYEVESLYLNDEVGLSSSNENVAIVLKNGTLEALTPGTTEITYKGINTFADEYELKMTVNVAENNSFAISPDSGQKNSRLYSDEKVVITAPKNATIYYTLDGTNPTNKSTVYTGPFSLENSSTVKAVYYLKNKKSKVISKAFTCLRNVPVLETYSIEMEVGQTKYIKVLETIDDDEWGFGLYDDISVDYIPETSEISVYALDVGEKTVTIYGVDDETTEINVFVTAPEHLKLLDKSDAEESSDEEPEEEAGADSEVLDYEEGTRLRFIKPTGTGFEDADIYYTTDGTKPSLESSKCSRFQGDIYGNITLDKSCTLKAALISETGETLDSFSQEFNFIRMKPLLSESAVTLDIGQSKEVKLVESPLEGIDNEAEWSSGNSDVAIVEDGIITAVGEGKTVINCTMTDKNMDIQTSSVSVTVSAPADDYMVIEGASSDGAAVDYEEGSSIKINHPKKSKVYYTTDGSAPSTSSTRYTKPIKLSADATLKAISVIDGDTVASASQEYKFIKMTPALSVSSLKLSVGGTEQVTVTEAPMDSTDESYVEWFSSDENIATVSEDGVITAVGEGKTEVSCEMVDKNGDAEFASVNVKVALADLDGNTFSSDEGRELNESGISVYGTDTFTYTGAAITVPDLSVYNNGYRLVLNKDYKVSYKNNKNVGIATAIVTLKGNYSGKKEFEFSIEKGDVSTALITGSCFTYANRKKTNTFEVRVAGRKLTLNKDYTITSGVAGDTEFTIEGKGMYEGYRDVSVTVLEKNESLYNLKNAAVTLTNSSYVYDGTAKKPGVSTITYGKAKTALSSGDFVIGEYKNNIKAGTASVILYGCGRYTGSKTVTFKITKPAIKAADFKIASTVTFVNGGVRPTIVSDLKEGVDYTVSLKNSSKVGTAKVTITGCGSYSGSFSKDYTILKKDISSCKIVPTDKTKIAVYDTNGTAISTKYYSYKYDKATNTGTVVGKGNYTGSAVYSFITYDKKCVSISKTKIIVSGTLSYIGEEVEAYDVWPLISIKYVKNYLLDTQYDIEVLNTTPVNGYINVYISATGEPSSDCATSFYGGKLVKIKAIAD